MSKVEFRNAYYIKLGQGGCWEADSLATGRLRIGWLHQSVDDINHGRWEVIAEQLREEHKDKPQVATTDLNRLRDIATSTPDDIWITFHGSKLWWARLASAPMEQDSVSKFRRTQAGWSDESLTGRLLVVNELPGTLAQLQGFRGTICRVREPQLLRRVLEGNRSTRALRISEARSALAQSLRDAIRELHWKDFETLVDLVFRHAGWVRVSVLGQHAKAYDLELRESITNDRYVVQVKSQAKRVDLEKTVSEFSADDYRRVFFVAHSPSADLADAKDIPDHVELVSPDKLADLALEAGLSRWLENKAW